MRRSVFLAILLLPVFLLPVSAHPGKTDAAGGHTDRSTGQYHYHHGYSAHQHTDMDGDGVPDCPYDFDDKTSHNSGSSSSISSSSSGKSALTADDIIAKYGGTTSRTIPETEPPTTAPPATMPPTTSPPATVPPATAPVVAPKIQSNSDFFGLLIVICVPVLLVLSLIILVQDRIHKQYAREQQATISRLCEQIRERDSLISSYSADLKKAEDDIASVLSARDNLCSYSRQLEAEVRRLRDEIVNLRFNLGL